MRHESFPSLGRVAGPAESLAQAVDQRTAVESKSILVESKSRQTVNSEVPRIVIAGGPSSTRSAALELRR